LDGRDPCEIFLVFEREREGEVEFVRLLYKVGNSHDLDR